MVRAYILLLIYRCYQLNSGLTRVDLPERDPHKVTSVGIEPGTSHSMVTQVIATVKYSEHNQFQLHHKMSALQDVAFICNN